MAIDLGSSNTTRYLSVADHADFTLPNSDWCWVAVLKLTGDTSGYVLSTGTYNASNTCTWYRTGNFIAMNVNGTERSTNISGIMTSGNWCLLFGRRKSSLLNVGGIDLFTSSITQSTTTSLAAASDGGQLNIGARSDQDTAWFFQGVFGYVALIKDTVTDAQIIEMANGRSPLHMSFAPNVTELWHMQNASDVVPMIAGHNLTLNGSSYAADDDIFVPYLAKVIPIKGEATSGQNLTASLFSDSDTFHTATVAPGAVNLSASLYSDSDTFLAATLTTTVNVSPSLYSDTDSFYTATVSSTVGLSPSLYSDSDTFYSATVGVGAVTLTPSLYSDADTFYAATVSLGGSPQNLTASLYVDSDTFPSATVSPGAVSISPSLYADADTFYAHTVALGGATQGLTPSLYTDADTFYAATVAGGALDLQPALFTSSNNFHAASVAPGAVNLAASLTTNTNTFLSSIVSSTYSLVAGLVTDADTFLTAVVSAGAANITPSLFSDEDTFYAATVVGGIEIPVPSSRTYTVEARNNVYLVQ